ncbi:MAG: gas vesicle protein [Actinomycetota bacterium]
MNSESWDLERPGRDGPVAGRSGDLADILERVLDKGVVIAGDIAINLLDIELLTIKLRLLVASADTAKAMGIDWWTSDPFLTGRRDDQDERRSLQERVDRLEAALSISAASTGGPPSGNGPETRAEDARELHGRAEADGGERRGSETSGDGGGHLEPAPGSRGPAPGADASVATPNGNRAVDLPSPPGRTGGSVH